jgi:hypothetical protein
MEAKRLISTAIRFTRSIARQARALFRDQIRSEILFGVSEFLTFFNVCNLCSEFSPQAEDVEVVGAEQLHILQVAQGWLSSHPASHDREQKRSASGTSTKANLAEIRILF